MMSCLINIQTALSELYHPHPHHHHHHLCKLKLFLPGHREMEQITYPEMSAV